MAPVWVFLGGGVGAVGRWAVSLMWISPWGTWIANIVGSCLLAGLLHPRVGLAEPWRLAVCTGLLGGFTTYSTFNAEVLSYLVEGEPGRAALLAGGSLVTCLLAGAVGYGLAGWWYPPS